MCVPLNGAPTLSIFTFLPTSKLCAAFVVIVATLPANCFPVIVAVSGSNP